MTYLIGQRVTITSAGRYPVGVFGLTHTFFPPGCGGVVVGHSGDNVVVSAFGLTGWPSFAAHASVSAVAAVMQLTVMGAQLKRSTGRGLFEGGK